MRKTLGIVAFALFCLYAIASLFVVDEAPQLAAVPLLMAAAIVILLVADRYWPVAIIPVMGVAVGLGVWMPAWLVYSPPVLLNLLVAGLFFGSLRPGGDALVTRIARIAHGGVLPQQFVGYTRKVTFAWGVALTLYALASALLAAFAPREWWWLFCNVLVYPAFVAMFVGEHIVRRRVFPDAEHVPMRHTVEVMRRHRWGRTKASR